MVQDLSAVQGVIYDGHRDRQSCGVFPEFLTQSSYDAFRDLSSPMGAMSHKGASRLHPNTPHWPSSSPDEVVASPDPSSCTTPTSHLILPRLRYRGSSRNGIQIPLSRS